MSVGKVIELSSEGESVEAAVNAAVQAATKTVRHVTNVYVKDIIAEVEDNKVARYRIHAKVTFLVQDD